MSVQQHQPARHPELHRAAPPASTSRFDREYRRSRGHGAARRRHARAGAEPDHDDEPAVVQGAERAVDLRVPGHAAEARAVRRAGRFARSTCRTPTPPRWRRCSARSSVCRASRCSRRSSPTRRRTRSPSAARRRGRRSSRRSSSRTTSRAPRSSSTSRSSRSTGTRAKSYGLNLSEYALGGIFSPEVVAERRRPPPAPARPAAPAADDERPTSGTSTPPSGVTSPPPFNLNTISRGVSTADFYLAVPTAIVQVPRVATRSTKVDREAAAARRRRHQADAEARRPDPGHLDQLHADRDRRRRREPAELVPVQGRRREHRHDAARHARRRHPASTSRRSTARAARDVNIGGVNIPSFGNAKVTTRLRLRDGESNLLAGLLQEDERQAFSGFPGAIHVPVLKQLFSSNDEQIDQTDIVMLLTPHIVRTHEITEAGSAADLHRLAAEPRARRTAAADRAAAARGRRAGAPRRRPAPRRPRQACRRSDGATPAGHDHRAAGRHRRSRARSSCRIAAAGHRRRATPPRDAGAPPPPAAAAPPTPARPPPPAPPRGRRRRADADAADRRRRASARRR